MNTKHTSVTPTQTAEKDLGTCGSTATVEAKENTQTGHTPGPWMIEYAGLSQQRVISRGNGSGSGMTVANVPPIPNGDFQANARLIAAAPDLLEACKKLMAIARNCSVTVGDDVIPGREFEGYEIGRAAIAKAEGNQNE